MSSEEQCCRSCLFRRYFLLKAEVKQTSTRLLKDISQMCFPPRREEEYRLNISPRLLLSRTILARRRSISAIFLQQVMCLSRPIRICQKSSATQLRLISQIRSCLLALSA